MNIIDNIFAIVNIILIFIGIILSIVLFKISGLESSLIMMVVTVMIGLVGWFILEILEDKE